MVAPAQSMAQRAGAEDSWIDVATQRSQSSLLPSNSNLEIVTTGLSLTQSNHDQNRPSRHQTLSRPSQRSTSAAGSSQDEYEESESESDHLMSSSNEDEDDTSTALGATSSQQHSFTPQPNAFSHPPATNNIHSAPAPDSYFPSISHITYSDRLPSNRTVTQRQHSRDHIAASRAQPDHDAALRASLTTLLSCAAAVRPKEHGLSPPAAQRATPARTFRLVPESELITRPAPDTKPLHRRRSRESSKDRQAKKMRGIRAATSADDPVSPTMMTWMISAGVVLVVSAISFSAGYAWGKDATSFDGELSCTSCGKEVVKTGSGGGLRKLRWAPPAQSVRA